MYWKQPICDNCWEKRERNLKFVQFSKKTLRDEICCDCGKETRSGVYISLSASEVQYPSYGEDL